MSDSASNIREWWGPDGVEQVREDLTAYCKEHNLDLSDATIDKLITFVLQEMHDVY